MRHRSRLVDCYFCCYHRLLTTLRVVHRSFSRPPSDLFARLTSITTATAAPRALPPSTSTSEETARRLINNITTDSSMGVSIRCFLLFELRLLVTLPILSWRARELFAMHTGDSLLSTLRFGGHLVRHRRPDKACLVPRAAPSRGSIPIVRPLRDAGEYRIPTPYFLSASPQWVSVDETRRSTFASGAFHTQV